MFASNCSPVDVIKAHVIDAAIVLACSAGGVMGGELLSYFETAATLQVGGNTGGTERMIPDFRLDAGSFRTTPDHSAATGLGKRRIR